MPPKIQRLIGELGLRFRPSAQTDLEAHAALVALLARDLADVNPDMLERAIEEHVRTSRFMPKASELREIANSIATKHGTPDLHAIAAKYNARLLVEGRRDIHWIVAGTELKIEHAHAFQPTSARPIRASLAEIEAYAKKGNAERRKAKSS